MSVPCDPMTLPMTACVWAAATGSTAVSRPLSTRITETPRILDLRIATLQFGLAQVRDQWSVR